MEELGLGWYVFGAQAAMVHGASRLTADVDVTVHLGDRSIHDLSEALLRRELVLRVDDTEFLEQTRVLPVTHEPTDIPVDIILAGPGLEELFLRRAVIHDVEGVPVPVASAEDLVVMKILAGRPKDLEDIVAVLAAGGEGMDIAMLRDTLLQLEEALGQSDLLPAFEHALARAADG
jgi:Nucleotidyl transferase AbiEii toxin, Type IV TA system